jgi:hypothetical protein
MGCHPELVEGRAKACPQCFDKLSMTTLLNTDNDTISNLQSLITNPKLPFTLRNHYSSYSVAYYIGDGSRFRHKSIHT